MDKYDKEYTEDSVRFAPAVWIIIIALILVSIIILIIFRSPSRDQIIDRTETTNTVITETGVPDATATVEPTISSVEASGSSGVGY